MRMPQVFPICFGWIRIGLVLSLFLARPVLAGIELSFAQAELRKAGLEDGGWISAERSTLALEQAWNFPDGGGLGLKLALERETWDFGGGHRFGAAPWRSVQQAVVSLPMRRPLSEGVVLVLLPRLAWAGEDGARAGDTRTAGIIGAALKVVDPHRRLGLGVEAVHTLDERWRLFNPPELGPAGSAGLELACLLGPRLELGLGVAERERRFRLAPDHARAAGGTGVVRQVQGFLHLSWTASPQVTWHAYAGAVLDGELALRDRAGHRLERDTFNTAPVLGISGRLRF
jgi:hypothetical protein